MIFFLILFARRYHVSRFEIDSKALSLCESNDRVYPPSLFQSSTVIPTLSRSQPYRFIRRRLRKFGKATREERTSGWMLSARHGGAGRFELATTRVTPAIAAIKYDTVQCDTFNTERTFSYLYGEKHKYILMSRIIHLQSLGKARRLTNATYRTFGASKVHSLTLRYGR